MITIQGPTDLEIIGRQLGILAHAVTANACPGDDAAGVSVSSLTEAAMGVTAGLCKIACAIDNLAEAVRDHGFSQETP